MSVSALGSGPYNLECQWGFLSRSGKVRICLEGGGCRVVMGEFYVVGEDVFRSWCMGGVGGGMVEGVG